MAYISYSGFSLLLSCPRAYMNRYVAPVSVGKENKVNALFGTVLGNLLEEFFKERLGVLLPRKNALATLVSRIDSATEKAIADYARRGETILFNSSAMYRSMEALKTDLEATLAPSLHTLYTLGFLEADTEVKLDSRFTTETPNLGVVVHTLGGRADFILTDSKGQVYILDGKGTRRVSTADPLQLKWYAMLYCRQNPGKPIPKTGFLFWRLPFEDQPFRQYAVTESVIKGLEAALIKTMPALEDRISEVQATPSERKREVALPLFPATPSDKCKLCSYRSVCAEGISFLVQETKDKAARVAEWDELVASGKDPELLRIP